MPTEYEIATAAARTELDVARMARPRIAIYSGLGCTRCAAVKSYFSSKNIIIEERQIADYPAIAEAARGMGLRTLPVLSIDEKICGAGFSRGTLDYMIRTTSK